ncbi:MAG: hypothetical protein HY817_04430 [Candidatus Abawacabacteria bacterium]|nr:hypothetical protein [Candidatus Abawacabacteria bacterium]
MNRCRTLRIVLVGLMIVLTLRLSFLQLIEGGYYQALAEQQHKGVITLQSRRGNIYLADKSGDPALLAADTALDVVFADPGLIPPEQEQETIDLLAPLLFEMPKDQEEKKNLLQQDEIILDEQGTLIEEVANSFPEIKPTVEVKETFESLLQAYKDTLVKKIRKKEVTHRVLMKKTNSHFIESKKEVERLQLRGIYSDEDEIYADPTIIDDPLKTAQDLHSAFDLPRPTLAKMLSRSAIRYVPLKHKLSPDISEKIKNLRLKNGKKLTGIGLIPEQWRFYPEGNLAAHIVGFLGYDKKGQYGLEKQFEEEQNGVKLAGVNGKLLIDRDPQGNQIVVGDKITTPPEDGNDITLTIDRVVQGFVETELEKQVKAVQAESGQVVVINPKTGAIIAVANYPSFDPNFYWESYEKWQEGIHAGEYKNKIGPAVFTNRAFVDMYEPGSVFKVITMSSGIDSGEITPFSINCEHEDTVYIDNFPVRNSTLKAYGCITMTKALEVSSNLTTLTVSRKLGRTLFYQYIKNFGFGETNPIEVDNGSPGWVAPPDRWADIDLAAAAFGQGIGATPLQVISAIGAVANDGILMKTHLIASYHDRKNDRTTQTIPQEVRRVIKKESADQVKGMMVSTAQKSYKATINIPGYIIAAKTGTAQIALKNGLGYEKGPGSTVGSIVGFPAQHPEFAILVKIDRPLSTPWGEGAAGPLFTKVCDYLLKYYTIPQDLPT